MRVNDKHLIDIGIITHYNDIPFTGVGFELYETSELYRETGFVNGLKHGKTVLYYKNGGVEEERPYVNDVCEGLVKEFHENGILKNEIDYVNGILQGLWRNFGEKGELQIEMNYVNNVRDGLLKVFGENGELKSQSNWINGVSVKEEKKEVYLPSAPELEGAESKVKYNFEKNASEFDDVKEILEFLNSDKQFRIRVDAYQYWNGFFQLKNDPKSDNIVHINLYHNYEEPVITVNEVDGKQIVTGDSNYDVNKQTYDDGFCVWANTIIDREFLIKQLTEYLSNDDNENEIYDFYQSLDLAEDPDTALEEFTSGHNGADKNSDLSIDMNYGKGRDFGVDDISWEVVSEIKDAGIEIIFFD